MELGEIPSPLPQHEPDQGVRAGVWLREQGRICCARGPERVTLGNLCLTPQAVSETNAEFLPNCQRTAGTVLGEPASSLGNARGTH